MVTYARVGTEARGVNLGLRRPAHGSGNATKDDANDLALMGIVCVSEPCSLAQLTTVQRVGGVLVV